MNKSMIITIILVILAIIIGAIFVFSNNDNKTNTLNEQNTTSGQNIINEINNISIPNNTINKPTVQEEVEISSFSTDLQGDTARLNNIRITCDSINGKTLKPNEVFSFNEIVGEPSEAKGYMEADVIVGTKVEKGFGGGNCQVSTTIYNACLAVSDIEIIERNPHKKKVTYIEEGKDASVSFSGGLDFKFKNNLKETIKIYINSDDNKVNCRIVKLQ